MRTLVAVMALVVAMVTVTGEAQSQFVDGSHLNEWRKEYKKPLEQSDKDHSASGLFMGYVAGICDGFNGQRFCTATGVTAAQVSDIVAKYLEEHPEIRHKAGYLLVTEALKKAFPCKK